MDKLQHEAGSGRYGAYRRLLDISAEKLEILRQGAFMDQLERFNDLGDEWDSLQKEIEGLEKILEPTSLAAENERIHEISLQIVRNQQQAEHLLQQEIGQLSGDLKSVHDYKTLINAYYGMNRKDQIAYYFDEKK
ncbi:hypothetical protein PAE9249_00476 [Paenibacillus sp. CECT 9249]|uniref:hypothetical protein n=1 Tax=Paenibacillus sp. CECT 9249 TaxID=2845385 RepID=UPI001E63BBE5|nr:hypothetical protein [Paenibacillus sp. CECT 9249]CAH0118011.1 hypothetical protein PAE9249_00476 [Paenibacillus sp. CECT 9249]